MGFSPNDRNIKFQKSCSECGTPRLIFSRYSLSGKETRDLSTKLDDLDDFVCGYDLHEVVGEDLKKKGVCINRNLSCCDPIEPIYYRMSNCDKICAWCQKPLNEDSINKLQSSLKTHSTVQPNCGERKCLKRNPGGLQGWTIKRPKRQKPNPKPKLKPKPNAKGGKGKKRGGPPADKPPEKRRKKKET